MPYESLITFTLRQRTHGMNTMGCHKSYTQNTIQKQLVSTWLYTQIKESANTELLQQEQLTKHKLKTRMCTAKTTTQTHMITSIPVFSDMTMWHWVNGS